MFCRMSINCGWQVGVGRGDGDTRGQRRACKRMAVRPGEAAVEVDLRENGSGRFCFEGLLEFIEVEG